jgi:hypothetical protein
MSKNDLYWMRCQCGDTTTTSPLWQEAILNWNMMQTANAMADKIAALEAENAKLRDDNSMLLAQADAGTFISRENIHQLQAENTRLRELIGRLAPSDGIHIDVCGPVFCVYCHSTNSHADNCPWVEARALLEAK